jgi:polar amino acid transport system substrate-binding protein
MDLSCSSARQQRTVWIALAIVGLCGSAPDVAAARDISVSMAQIPNLIDSADEGPFVELVKAIDEAYEGGTLTRRMFPFTRSIENVVRGLADCQIPMFRNPDVDGASLPYRFLSEPLGTVSVVLYSHVDRPLEGTALQASLRGGGPLPYKVETLRGSSEFGAFTKSYTDSIEQGLRRVAAGRIDAFFMVQDEGDYVLRKLKLKTIYRSLYRSFDDVMVIPKGARGDDLDRELSGAIRSLKASERWNPIYYKIHRPYDAWQPSAQGW